MTTKTAGTETGPKNFSVIFKNQPWRNRTFPVRGVCEFDVLNPCWDNRPDDVPGKHWGGEEFDACPACTKAAFAATPPRKRQISGRSALRVGTVAGREF